MCGINKRYIQERKWKAKDKSVSNDGRSSRGRACRGEI